MAAKRITHLSADERKAQGEDARGRTPPSTFLTADTVDDAIALVRGATARAWPVVLRDSDGIGVAFLGSGRVHVEAAVKAVRAAV